MKFADVKDGIEWRNVSLLLEDYFKQWKQNLFILSFGCRYGCVQLVCFLDKLTAWFLPEQSTGAHSHPCSHDQGSRAVEQSSEIIS